jgi:GDPmannose 4,6-dehydratase
MKKVALITGITGQDGSYLAEYLLSKNYIVHGVKRRSSSYNTDRIDHLIKESHIKSNFILHYGDVVDSLGLLNIIRKIKPDEIYNLAAQSHVAVSFESPEYTANADGLGPLRILEIIKSLKLKCKFYQASTSELFGDTAAPQNENSKLEPQSPYAAAKLYSYHITKIYRNAYGIHASNGILFNHESPRRGETFLTRKVTMGVAKIFLGKLKCIYVGNIYSKRDWGHAKEYVESMWKILNQKKSNDYVIATGRSYTVKKFIEIAFKNIGISIGWRGKGLNEVGFDKKNKDILIKISPKYFRPLEVNHLMGKSLRSHKILKWKPKIKIEKLVKEMVEEDIKLLKKNFNK